MTDFLFSEDEKNPCKLWFFYFPEMRKILVFADFLTIVEKQLHIVLILFRQIRNFPQTLKDGRKVDKLSKNY